MQPKGQTSRSELAVRAYRALWGDSLRLAEQRSPRRLILRGRLDAMLRIMTPLEYAYYSQQTRMLAQESATAER